MLDFSLCIFDGRLVTPTGCITTKVVWPPSLSLLYIFSFKKFHLESTAFPFSSFWEAVLTILAASFMLAQTKVRLELNAT